MDKILEELLKSMPWWFYSISAILILIGMVATLWWLILGAKRFSDAIGRESRLSELQAQLNNQRDESRYYFNVASQLVLVMSNVQMLQNELNKLRQSYQDAEFVQLVARGLIQRCVESLSSDIKTLPGERHRCALWFEQDRILVPYFGSAGFPDHYINNRQLDLNRSIAGNCFRRKEEINVPDVTLDKDWSPNPDSNSPYKALICIPVSQQGVLTIDGQSPMNEQALLIGKLYNRIIEGALNEIVYSVQAQAAKEAAAYSEEG